jgi:DNA-binding MarR family transcriptional regulator
MSAFDRESPSGLRGSRHLHAEGSPGFLFWKVFNHWNRQLRTTLELHQLTQVQYSILAALVYLSETEAHVMQQDIARLLSMDKMMVSDVSKTLVGRKLLKREPHPTDKRAFSLRATPKARELLELATPLIEACDDAFFGRLPESELAAFKQALLQLADSC